VDFVLLILGGLAAVATVIVVAGRRMRWSLDVAELGTVSERWLAEYRASHPS
jgi:hypothetical protein